MLIGSKQKRLPSPIRAATVRERWVNAALYKLIRQGHLVGTSGFDPVGGIGSVLGVVSTEMFDEVFVTTQPTFGTHVFIDDLHW
jgi:hypothetical protein